MTRDDSEQTQAENRRDLAPEELDAQEATELPEREEMSIINTIHPLPLTMPPTVSDG
jgi:hypothetical protein